MITHQMEVIKQIADRVAVIENGRIIEESSVVDLFTAPKTETSRKFIGSVISNDIPESLQHMHFTPEKQHPGDLTALRLSFRGDVADEPIVANLIRKYNLDVSILYGNIDYIHGVPFGKLIVTMDGNETDISAALSHLKIFPSKARSSVMSPAITNLLLKSLGETLYMLGVSAAIAAIVGIPLGILLVVTERAAFSPARRSISPLPLRSMSSAPFPSSS